MAQNNQIEAADESTTSKKLEKEDYRNERLPSGVDTHTIILFINEMLDPKISDEQRDIYKYQLAASILPDKKEFHAEKQNVILTSAIDFLKAFKLEKIDKSAD